MTREEVISLLRRHGDALNRHDVDALASLYSDQATIVSPMFDTVQGRAAIRRSYEQLFATFPDYSVRLRDALFIWEGNRAAEFTTVTGTHRVELFGLPPTGHQIEYHAARLFTLADGQIVDEQRIYDFGGVLERLEKTRIDRELSLASAVQQTLLRTTHGTDWMDAVGSSLPCRAIGGDFVECFDLPSGAVGLAVGDVSGKGPAAALVAAMLQGMFSVVALQDESPTTVLRRLNQALFRRGIEPRFATLVYGVLTPAGTFTYSNAGHNPPFLLNARGAQRLTAGGPILGVFEQADFPEETWQLKPGDSLVAFSDGVTEAVAPDGSDFGLERLISTAERARNASAPELLDRLFSTVREFCGAAPPIDDVTIVVGRLR
jgi:steroid delta-isomerase-like uncharacterized protein